MKKMQLTVLSEKDDYKDEEEFLSDFFHNPEKFQVDVTINKDDEGEKK